MSSNYWYISAPKVKALKGTKTRLAIDKIGLKIKTAWLEGEVSAQFSASLLSEVKAVDRKLRAEPGVSDFWSLGSPPSSLFSFSGPGGKAIQNGVFWLATFHADTALLLVGAASNVTGGASSERSVISPSAAPIQSVANAFKQDTDETLSSRLTFAWQAICKDTGVFEGSLPSVYGLAFLGGVFLADE